MLELSAVELRHYREPIRTELEALCASDIFRNSQRSCEFIRHVVSLTLDDRTDELKERLIGMALLGRDASYDTSTDSGVRVRANDVRKRLNRYNEAGDTAPELMIVLSTGTYVPRFFRLHAAPNDHFGEPLIAGMPGPAISTPEFEIADPPSPPASPSAFAARPLSWLQLAAPTLLAVFLCIVAMRWQLAQEQYFTNFWQQVLGGDQTQLYLAPSLTEGRQQLVAMQEFDEVTPLLDLAGRFHRRFTVMSSDGGATETSTSVRIGFAAEQDSSGLRYALRNTAGGRVIVDERDPSRQRYTHAALLTIVNHAHRTISIDGTDDNAIRTLISRLCDEGSFPGVLRDSLTPESVLQGVFPMGGHSKPLLVKQTPGRTTARLEYWP